MILTSQANIVTSCQQVLRVIDLSNLISLFKRCTESEWCQVTEFGLSELTKKVQDTLDACRPKSDRHPTKSLSVRTVYQSFTVCWKVTSKELNSSSGDISSTGVD
jgi:hypothetical protein